MLAGSWQSSFAIYIAYLGIRQNPKFTTGANALRYWTAKKHGELKKALPAITEKMLIQTLKELEADEIITRKATPVVPPHVEYSLTLCGQELSPVLLAMIQWAKKFNV